jgi:hypothetical protein
MVFFFFEGRKMNNKRKKRKERNRLGAPAAGAAPSHFFSRQNLFRYSFSLSPSLFSLSIFCSLNEIMP